MIDQLKRNTALISNYLVQKKKEFTENSTKAKKSDDQEEAPQGKMMNKQKKTQYLINSI